MLQNKMKTSGLFLCSLTVIFSFFCVAADPAVRLSLSSDAGQNKEQCHSLVNPADMDRAIHPGDDFYQYACGNWLKHNPIPKEYPLWGSSSVLAQENYLKLRAILEEAIDRKDPPLDGDLRKAADFYAAGMDTAVIEAHGMAALKPELDLIQSIGDTAALQSAIESLHQIGVDALFSLGSIKDPDGADMVYIWVMQGGQGLPEKDYYFDSSERGQKMRIQYLEHIQRMFQLLGESKGQAGKSARAVLAFETRLAKASLSNLEWRDPKKFNNKISIEALNSLASPFDFRQYFSALGARYTATINATPAGFFSEIGHMLRELPVAEWQTYLRWRLLSSAAPYLHDALANENFSFHGTVLRGIPKLRPRWRRVIDSANESLRDIIGRLYVEKFFPPQAKTRAQGMVKRILKAMKLRLQNCTWMEEETKRKALEKLATFSVKIGYPDQWMDYGPLEINRTFYWNNIKRANRHQLSVVLAKVGKPSDRQEWGMGAQIINAYYNPLLNEIAFPAAILQPPFFDFQGDDAENLGGIGTAIGHEIIHGFDDEGRQYDAHGGQHEWWTPGDSERFNTRVQVLVQQVNRYRVSKDVAVNGELTLGENIADLGGLLLGFDALQEILRETKDSQVISGFTPEQRFYLAWARVWQRNVRPEMLILQAKSDVHPPAVFRVNGPLSNLDSFYRTFGVKPGHKLYRPENERVNIW